MSNKTYKLEMQAFCNRLSLKAKPYVICCLPDIHGDIKKKRKSFIKEMKALRFDASVCLLLYYRAYVR